MFWYEPVKVFAVLVSMKSNDISEETVSSSYLELWEQFRVAGEHVSNVGYWGRHSTPGNVLGLIGQVRGEVQGNAIVNEVCPETTVTNRQILCKESKSSKVPIFGSNFTSQEQKHHRCNWCDQLRQTPVRKRRSCVAWRNPYTSTQTCSTKKIYLVRRGFWIYKKYLHDLSCLRWSVQL